MANHQHSVFVQPQRSTEVQNRVTMVVDGHFLEADTGNTTFVRHAYDRSMHSGLSAFQSNVRLAPGERVEIPIGKCIAGKCQYILSHQAPKTMAFSNAQEARETYSSMRKAIDSNNVVLFDAEGHQIGYIPMNEACVMFFTGKVYAESQLTTAILNVTVLPGK